MKALEKYPWLAEVLALLGGILYTLQLFRYAHSQESVLDEGAYVFKGLLFASGQYAPYQPYGPWTNHMPLAFLIPGWFQTLFEPGLRTARYSAIFWAVLLLLGMYLLTRRLGGRWWAAGVVWLMAVNPFMLKTYSTAVTQGLIACMLVWMLLLTLGEGRPMWQIILGSVLAGLMTMTRINMLPVLPLLVLYIFWEHGRKAGLMAALSGGLVVVGFHLIYWPDILQLWTRLPRAYTPFLNDFRLPKSYQSSWKPDISLSDRIMSGFQSLRFQFAALIGVLATVLLWPSSGSWKRRSDFRAAVFLAVLFLVLLLAHLSQALGKDYCVYCLAGYIAFFSQGGLLLLLLAFPVWRTRLPVWLQVIALLLILLVSFGIGYGSFEQTGQALVDLSLPRWMLLDFRSGSVTLGALAANKFGLAGAEVRRWLPGLFGLLAGLLVLFLAAVLRWWYLRRRPEDGSKLPSYAYLALVVFLIAGVLLAPTRVLAGGYTTYDCSGDAIAAQEAAGRHLAEHVPPGSLVYWKGPLSVIPLLYLKDIRIFPAQINDGYSHLNNGDDLDLVARFGRWNEPLAHQWAAEADIILIEQRTYKGWLRDLVNAGDFEELPATPPTAACRDDSKILIFKRVQ